MKAIKAIYIRFLSKTPRFFRIIRNFCLSLSATATFIISLKSGGIMIPEWLSDLMNQTTVISGLIASFIAQLTTNFDDDMKEHLQELSSESNQEDIGGGNTGTIKP